MVHLEIIQGEAATEAELAELEGIRPKARGECEGQPGICPFVSCRHHLLLDISRQGVLKVNGLDGRPDDEQIFDRLLEMEHTCSLDVTDEHEDGLNRVAVGKIMGLTRERVRHLERQTSAEALMDGFQEYFGERRPISDSLGGNGPASGGRRASRPASTSYPRDIKRKAVNHFRKTGNRKEAADIVERACGRRPRQDDIAQWGAQLWPKHAPPELKRKAAQLREKGLTLNQISDELASEYGRDPGHTTVRSWIRWAKERG